MPPGRFASNSGSRAVAAADFNLDGRPDLATGNQNAAFTTVLTNSTILPTTGFSFHTTLLGTPSSCRGLQCGVCSRLQPRRQAGPRHEGAVSDNRHLDPADRRRHGDLDRDRPSSIPSSSSSPTSTATAVPTCWSPTADPGSISSRRSATGAAASHRRLTPPHRSTGVASPQATSTAMRIPISPSSATTSRSRVTFCEPCSATATARSGPARRAFSTPHYHAIAAVGDLNRDGRTDAVVAKNGVGLEIWFGNGAGAFTSECRRPGAQRHPAGGSNRRPESRWLPRSRRQNVRRAWNRPEQRRRLRRGRPISKRPIRTSPASATTSRLRT